MAEGGVENSALASADTAGRLRIIRAAMREPETRPLFTLCTVLRAESKNDSYDYSDLGVSCHP